MLSPKTKTLYIIDGYGFIFRAFYAVPNLTAPDGTPIGAVYGLYDLKDNLLDQLTINDNGISSSSNILKLNENGRFSEISKSFENDYFVQS